MPANARHASPEALEHLAIALGGESRTGRLDLIGQKLDVGIILLQPGVVKLAVDRRDARISLLAREHTVAEHEDLGLLNREIPPFASEDRKSTRLNSSH